MPASLMTYWRTVRHLRREQIWNRLRRRLPIAALPEREAPPLRQAAQPFGEPLLRGGPIREGNRFHFLNRSGIVTQTADWDDAGLPKLWRYNLHYFDWLRERAALERVDDDAIWIDRWIAENSAAKGTGWEPYPISLRVINWIIWFSTIGTPTSARLHSLARQVRQLERTIETHLLGNHLFVNAKALVFAGSFFCGEEADRWRARGLEILRAQLPEQILADGGHFELSPMYHALCFEDVLDLIGLEQSYPDVLTASFAPFGLTHIGEQMGNWLAQMSHPDGDIAYFNDASFGIAPPLHSMAAYAHRRGIRSPIAMQAVTLMPASGYARLAAGPFACFFDCGRVGPDYIPGHAHADTLSFELSIGSERIITNSGTSTYAIGPDREWERATRAHSTVEIDEENSAEVWASFRVGRRPNVSLAKIGDLVDGMWIEAQHDGYAHLPGAPTHKRRVTVTVKTVEVADRIDGNGVHAVSGFFHVHPGVEVFRTEGGDFMLVAPSGMKANVRIDSIAETEIIDGRYAAGFEKVVPRKTIVWRWRGALPFEICSRVYIV